MSARERNQMKRKMKSASKFGSKDSNRFSNISSSSSSVTASQKKRKIDDDKESEVDSNTTVIAFKPKPDISALGVFSTGDEWPFEGLCEQLSFDLFSPQWTVRHGAAIGLRELLKVHGSGLGKLVGLDRLTNDRRQQRCLEDLAIRLLCVLSLDQFADYVGDQAVVPVRETCAQTLGVIVQYCSSELCLKIVNLGLLEMINYIGDDSTQKYPVRLASLIGLKYWMAVRKDLLEDIFKPTIINQDSPIFIAIVSGLKDHNDDVRAVATSSLIPISDLLVKIVPEKRMFDAIVVCLWDSLQELDDLTAATSFVMNLLSDLIKIPKINAILQKEATQFLEKLVPQLFPFFRHAITSVRIAVLRTLIELTKLPITNTAPIAWIETDLLRLLFQNFVLEERDEVIELSLLLWSRIVDMMKLQNTSNSLAGDISKTILPVLFGLVMSPIGTAIDPRLCISYVSTASHDLKQSAKGSSGLNIPPHDKAMMNQDLTVVSYDDVLHGRIKGSVAMGRIICALHEHPAAADNYGIMNDWILAYVHSSFAFHRVMIGIVIQSWVTSSLSPDIFYKAHSKLITDDLMQILAGANAGGKLLFVELQDQVKILHSDCVSIHKALHQGGQITPNIPMLVAANGEDQFTIETAEFYLDKICKPLIICMPPSLVELFNRTILSRANTKNLQKILDTRVYSSLSSAVVISGTLPQKLNPIIRNLMSSVQTEVNVELQQKSCAALALMVKFNTQLGLRASTNDKMVKNTCVYLCSDPSVVGILKDNRLLLGIVTMTELKVLKVVTQRSIKKKSLDLDESAHEAIHEAESSEINEQEKLARMVSHRGAEAVLQHLCIEFKARLFEDVSCLWNIMSQSLAKLTPLFLAGTASELDVDDPQSQELADSLHVIAIIAKYVDAELHVNLMTLFPHITECLKCPVSLIRHLAAKCIASFAKEIKHPAMLGIIDIVIQLTSHLTNNTDRQGSVETLYHVIDQLGDDVLPYLIFLMAPLLSRMSDSNEDIRFIATNSFAQLVKLAPLESGAANPIGFSTELIARKNLERKFIGQLIGTEKVSEFELPVTIAAELRSYQKEGVSWLAFLNRYGLHGILCDGTYCLSRYGFRKDFTVNLYNSSRSSQSFGGIQEDWLY